MTPLLLLALCSSSGGGEALILQYRLFASGALGLGCVFTPSCSRFAEEAVEMYGPLPGAMLALDRWTRCHPGAPSDPDYPPGEGPIHDPPSGQGEVTEAWGLSLLPF